MTRNKIMNPYDKLEHEQRSWSVEEVADFLGYCPRYVRRLIRQGKIDGWWKVEGGDYRFCPAKLKVWMEKRFNGNGKPSGPKVDSNNKAGKDGEGEAA